MPSNALSGSASGPAAIAWIADSERPSKYRAAVATMAGTMPGNAIEKKSAIAATSAISVTSDAHQRDSAAGLFDFSRRDL